MPHRLSDRPTVKDVAQDINDNLDVDGLCREFPYRPSDRPTIRSDQISDDCSVVALTCVLTCVAPVMLCSVSVEDDGSLDFPELDAAVHAGVLLDASRWKDVAQDMTIWTSTGCVGSFLTALQM